MHSCTFVSPRRWRLWVFLLFALLGSPSLIAQVDGGRAAFGFNAGLAKYFGEFSDNSWWLGGDAFIRYNIVPMLALQAQFNIANPRFRVNVDNAIAKYTDYYGTGPNAREGGHLSQWHADSRRRDRRRWAEQHSHFFSRTTSLCELASQPAVQSLHLRWNWIDEFPGTPWSCWWRRAGAKR